MLFTLTQCFEETVENIDVIPFDQIEKKLEAIRNLQEQLRNAEVEVAEVQSEIDQLIKEINAFIPPGAVPLTYTVSVVSAARGDNQAGVSGAEVTIDVAGERVTVTTDSDGQARFDGLRSGVLLVDVTVPGYTDVSFVADLVVSDTDDYRNEDYNVSSMIALYPLTEDNGAIRMDGRLFYDSDRTDDLTAADPGYNIVPYFSPVTAAVQPYRPAPFITTTNGANPVESQDILDARVQSWETLDQSVSVFAFIQPNTQDFGFVPVGIPGNIVLAIYDELFVSATSSATNGTFQLLLPLGVNGHGCRFHLSEFVADETYNREFNFDTGTGITSPTVTRTRSVVFTPLYAFSEFFPGVFVAPGNSGSTNFSQANVNNFTATLDANGSYSTRFYYSAKTRDE